MPVDDPTTAWMRDRFRRLEALARESGYRGWDPFDLPNARLLAAVPQDRWLPQVVISKFGSRVAPNWLRRALRVPAIEDPKIYSLAYFAYRFGGATEHDGRAEEMLDALVRLGTRPDGVYWGYDFTWATRSSGISPRRGTTLVPASFALAALLHHRLATGDGSRDEVITRGIEHLRRHHMRTGPDGPYLEYFPGSDSNTHNANLLGCAALTLGGVALDREDWMQDAATAAATTLRAVPEDGFLLYADHASGGWTDCFHHLYVIGCATIVRRMNPKADHALCDLALERLVAFFRRSFPRPDGQVNYFPGRLHPIDPHNYAAAAIARTLLADVDLGLPEAPDLLRHVDEQMWDARNGWYWHRRHPRRTDRRMFLRWTQMWMLAAFATALAGRDALAA